MEEEEKEKTGRRKKVEYIEPTSCLCHFQNPPTSLYHFLPLIVHLQTQTPAHKHTNTRTHSARPHASRNNRSSSSENKSSLTGSCRKPPSFLPPLFPAGCFLFFTRRGAGVVYIECCHCKDVGQCGTVKKHNRG